MKKKLLAVLMTGVMAASFAGTATVVSADSGDDNTLTVWAWDQNFNIKSMQMAGEQYAKDHEGFSVDIIETSSDDCLILLYLHKSLFRRKVLYLNALH